jgi:hypothetical protein
LLGVLRTEAEATATFHFTRHLGLRAEWERADKSRLNMWSVGGQCRV